MSNSHKDSGRSSTHKDSGNKLVEVLQLPAYSDAIRPPIPIHSGRPFRSIPATPEGVMEAALDNRFESLYPPEKPIQEGFMAARRLSVRKIKEVLRLHCEKGLSTRQIAKSLDISRSTIRDYLDRAQRAGLGWPLPSELDEASLEHRLFPSLHAVPQEKRQMPSPEYLHQELKKKGVTLQLLWHEYKEKNPEGYQYSQFCRLYHQWAEKLDPCLRQEYRAGEKLFVDYAGQTMEIIDPETGEIHQAQIFVATLGASNYTFAEATLSQDLASWIQSHVHAFEFFQGVTEILVPDNLKDAVTRPCRYEPDLNATYRELANIMAPSLFLPGSEKLGTRPRSSRVSYK